MDYSYDRTAADFDQLARASKSMLGEMKKTRLQLGELRGVARTYIRAAAAWTPEEEESLPDEAHPDLGKKVADALKLANEFDKALQAIEDWDPPG
jgi:hypothetical protein